jgi:hypothetical protein
MDDVSASLVNFKALLREKSFHHAEVAELADALASGASGRKVVEVRVLSSAPSQEETQSTGPFPRTVRKANA